MEVVLLWLDEAEDLVFAIASRWEYVRSAVLQVGLLAALALHSSEWWSGLAAYALLLASIALLSVLVWAIGLFVPLRGAFRRPRIASSP